jgi:hypothetical protein
MTPPKELLSKKCEFPRVIQWYVWEQLGKPAKFVVFAAQKNVDSGKLAFTRRIKIQRRDNRMSQNPNKQPIRAKIQDLRPKTDPKRGKFEVC